MQYQTAGESHGLMLSAIVEDVPAGLAIDQEVINADLQRRQHSYGRGMRQVIEKDQVKITSGIRFGKTTGSPIALHIKNRDAENWKELMSTFGDIPESFSPEVTPRPGHADLVGALKQNAFDCRDIFERSSARETAIRVAAAGIAREFLAEIGVDIQSYVTQIGSVVYEEENPYMRAGIYAPLEIELSEVRCPHVETSEKMKKEIDKAREAGDSLGGKFRVVATGLIPGLGTYAQTHDRLQASIAQALFSIPAVKGVEFGLGFASADHPGSQVHDPISLRNGKFVRTSNNAGGLEAGMTTGMPLVITVAMKPIPTLQKPLSTINLDTLALAKASRERSDVCAVPNCAVVAEAELAFVLVRAYQKQFGAGCIADVRANIQQYEKRLELRAQK